MVCVINKFYFAWSVHFMLINRKERFFWLNENVIRNGFSRIVQVGFFENDHQVWYFFSYVFISSPNFSFLVSDEFCFCLFISTSSIRKLNFHFLTFLFSFHNDVILLSPRTSVIPKDTFLWFTKKNRSLCILKDLNLHWKHLEKNYCFEIIVSFLLKSQEAEFHRAKKWNMNFPKIN